MAEIQHSCKFRPFSKTQHITHIALCARSPPVLCDFHRRLIGLQHMVPVQKLMQMIVHDGKITVCALDRPVCHILSAQVYIIALKLLLHAVEREGVYIFSIDDCRFQ